MLIKQSMIDLFQTALELCIRYLRVFVVCSQCASALADTWWLWESAVMRFSHSGEDVDAFFYFLAQCNVAVMLRRGFFEKLPSLWGPLAGHLAPQPSQRKLKLSGGLLSSLSPLIRRSQCDLDVGGSADVDASVLLGRWKPRLARLPLVQLTLELVGILG